MACNYYFEGNFIGDELKLASFLLTKHKYLKQFGDLVFLLTERALKTSEKLEGEITQKGKEAKEKLNRYVANHGIEYGEDGRAINLETPAMGVNRFLQKYTHNDGPMKGHRIIPEFILEEYWKRKLEEWENLKFSEEEKELIAEIEGTLYIEDLEKNPKTPPLDVREKWRDYIQRKWDALGKIGTSLHAVSELFFSKTNGVYNFEVLEAGGITGLLDFYNNHFKNESDEYGKIKFGEHINFDLFRSMIEMCSKLKKLLLDKYGKNLTFYPEYTVSADLVLPFQYEKSPGKFEECKEIIGIIDLLVVDAKGRIHIFDYKTSPKEYSKYSKAKERGFTYLLAVYDRILQHYGIYTGDGSTNIIPVKLDNFHYENNQDKFIFDNISFEITQNSLKQVNIKELPIKGNDKISRDLDEFLPSDVKLEASSENLLDKVQKAIHKWCPTYQLQKNMDDELLKKMIEQGGGFKKNKNGELVFKFNYGFGEPIVIGADVTNLEAEMFKKIKEEIASWTLRKQSMLEAFKDDFEAAQRSESHVFEYRHSQMGYGKNSSFISELITPYCNENYEIVDCKEGFYLGLLMLKDKRDNTVTVLKLTGSPLEYLHEFVPGRTNLNGLYAPDIEEDSKGNSLMLKATSANIEAMEAMLALLFLNFNLEKVNIRELKVINPRTLKSLTTSNKELLYSYRTLMRHDSILGEDTNKYEGAEPKLRMLSDAERLRADFSKIMLSNSFGNNSDKFNENVRPEIERLNALDWNIDISKDRLYDELDSLRRKLESLYPSLLKEVHRELSDIIKPENLLYNAIMSTMMELKGIDVRLLIEDADNWCQNYKIWKTGWEGLMLENTGNFRSPILNLLTKSVSNVYLKVKDKVNKENVTVRRLVESLKKLKNFGWVRSNISGNLTDMYKDMTYVSSDGDFLFVNPNTLNGTEREFLEHALKVINDNRYPTLPQELLESWKNNSDPRYYRVPLMAASDASKMSTDKMLSVGKERLFSMSPKKALKEILEKAMGFFSEDLAARQDDKLKLYEMSNIFENGELECRERMLMGKDGTSRANEYEHNIETILLAHCYAYELKNQMDKEMPIIKASALALAALGAGANTDKGNFNNLLDFIENYTKGVIKNHSIVNPKFREAQATVGKVRKAASFLALAFSPILFTYLSLEGVWKACSLIIRKPDGTDAFTARHMWDSAKEAYSDLSHYSDKPTKCLLVNEAYGINDMDANLFTKRISSDQGIWTHFTDFAFRFASRPDFYNRMTIFGALMRADGTWDAHEVVDGELVYRFDKDKRYAAIKTAPKGSTEYNEALSRYISALELFRKEGVTNPDGSELKFGNDLPRAYTNLEAQGMKAIADGMYGYYNHENKSMFNSMLLGGLVSQMKTYWSAKKNQYLAPGGVKLMGKWEDYQEDGQLLYYQVDDRGEIDLSKPFVKEGEPGNSGIKVQKWKGLWQEGIVLTLSKFAIDGFHNGYKKTWDGMINNTDANLRLAYRSNLKHLAIDLFFIFIMGNIFAALMDPWKDEKEKEFNRDLGDMGKAMELAGVSLIADSFNRSFMDFNFIDSIFSPTMDWLPFAFSSMSRLVTNISKYVTTDASFASTIANSASALRLAKPILKTIGYEED